MSYCLDLGISADSASRLLIFLGLSSCVARVATGRLCDVTWINTIFIYQLGDLLVGFTTIALPVIQSYPGLLAYVVIYGFGDGIYVTTLNSLLMFTVNEKRRAAALGLGDCLVALGRAAGAPMAGEKIRENNTNTHPRSTACKLMSSSQFSSLMSQLHCTPTRLLVNTNNLKITSCIFI